MAKPGVCNIVPQSKNSARDTFEVCWLIESRDMVNGRGAAKRPGEEVIGAEYTIVRRWNFSSFFTPLSLT